MFVPCPHCQFLVAHHPQLRPLPADCPRCGRPLQQEPDAIAAADATGADTDAWVQDSAGEVPTSHPGHAGDSEENPAAGAGAMASVAAAEATDTSAEDGKHTTPAAVAGATRRASASRWRWPLIALLALLLVLQILLADRARLAADPRWRPLVESLCGVLRCELPPWREPGAFTMLDRKVRPDRQGAGALRVDATFRNDARWPQAWPALQLALADADGRVLGSRVFAPADYLGAAPATLLSPGQSAQITFVVQEPAPGTVAFSFEFR